MKFKIGDKVEKISGYTFVGRVVGAYEVEKGIRYDVQINGRDSVVQLYDMLRAKVMTVKDATVLIELELLIMNCHGMIHIFTEEQLKLADQTVLSDVS